MKINKFATLKDLEQKLAQEIVEKLKISIDDLGKAKLLVSGGTSPKKLFQLLSFKDLEWSKVTVGLIDERFVSNQDEASNERLVKENLLINNASKAKFVSLVYQLSDEKNNLVEANKQYEPFFQNITVSILGMGEDGHTASLFPKDNQSENDLYDSKIEIISTLAPVEPKHRISCSKALILNSDSLFLMIIGESKIDVLEKAKQNKHPISHFFESKNGPLKVFYTEKK